MITSSLLSSLRKFARIPLTKISRANFSTASPMPVRVTRLNNGLRVATLHDRYTPFSSIGVYVKAGSRYEPQDALCASQFLSNFAYKDNSLLPNATEILADVGGNMAAMATRENLIFQGSMLNAQVPNAMRLLASTVISREEYTSGEIANARENILFAISETLKSPALYVREYLFHVAFGSTGLSLSQNSFLCENSAANMSSKALSSFSSKFSTPDRMVLAYAGSIEHDTIVELAEKYFQNASKSISVPKSSLKKEIDINSNSTQTQTQIKVHVQNGSHYTGGTGMYKLAPPPLAHPNETRKLTHIQLAFLAPSCLETEDSIAMHCLQYLLGGGDAFSSGGPGKGMYSRLFTNVLNRNTSIESCVAFYEPLADAGLFGIQAACGHHLNSRIFGIIAAELLRVLYGPFMADEFQRTKNQLKSNMMIALESQIMRTENLGVQLLARDSYVTPHEVSKMIDSVTVDQIKRLAANLFSLSPGTCVVHSECLDGIPPLDKEIDKLLRIR